MIKLLIVQAYNGNSHPPTTLTLTIPPPSCYRIHTRVRRSPSTLPGSAVDPGGPDATETTRSLMVQSLVNQRTPGGLVWSPW